MATVNVPEIFGSMVFNQSVMKEMLPEETYNALKNTMEDGTPLDLEAANQIAEAMKNWAISKGATHYSHWFQPLTGITAEKHDSFITAPMENGKVLYTADEPTGGTHMTLVLGGFYRCSTDEAEVMKKDPAQEHAVFPVIRPVVEKMASIVKANLRQHPVDAIYVVGGACCFSQFEQVFEKNIGISTIKPAAPLLVTPLGIAMNA